MTLHSIEVPAHINSLPHTAAAVRVIESGTNKIDAYERSAEPVIHNYVRCDFHLLDQALTWIHDNHLLTGNRFCELGSGFGIAAMLASLHGMTSLGIEIEPFLVDQSRTLAHALDLPTQFYCGSFVPRHIANILELSRDVEHVATDESDVYEEIGMELDEFDLLFAFPWPGEQHFFESVFQQCAAAGSCLLSYRGREGMHLLRKV